MQISIPSTLASFLSSTFSKCYTQPLRNFSCSHTSAVTHLVVFQLSEVTEGKECFPGFLPDVQWSHETQWFNCSLLAWRPCAQGHSQRKWDLVRLIHKYFLERWNSVEWHSSHLTTKHGRCNPMKRITWALKGIIWGGTVGLCSFARDLNNSWFCGKRGKKKRKEREYFGLW